MTELTERHCVPCEGGIPPMNIDQAKKLQKEIPEWQLKEVPELKLERTFKFKNYYHTIAFVNAIAWIAHQENHHPDLLVTYNQCTVNLWTHAVSGLSENDFICAAKIDALGAGI